MQKAEIAEQIKKARIRAGMTQIEVAEKLGVTVQAVSNYERGKNRIDSEKLLELCKIYGISVADFFADAQLPKDAIPYRNTPLVPLLGVIPAGTPLLAVENIEDYLPADVPDPENYFFLRVRGDSMVGARIFDGDLVLVRRQSWADNRQVVACRLNGDEVTLKRFKQQGETVLLLAENQAYEPRILSQRDFSSGEASILGVVTEVRYKL